MKKTIIILLVVVLVLVGLWYLGSTRNQKVSTQQTLQNVKSNLMTISSPNFAPGEKIAIKNSCNGANVNPVLEISGVPEKALTLALIMDDPDAPNGTWTHWILWNIDPKTTHINENSVPINAVAGVGSNGKNTYSGPCPPSGTHRYFFRLYALNATTSLPNTTKVDGLRSAMQGHVIAEAELMGTYSK